MTKYSLIRIGFFLFTITSIGWTEETEKLPRSLESKPKQAAQDGDRKTPPRGERRTSERDSDRGRDERTKVDEDGNRESNERARDDRERNDRGYERERDHDRGRYERDEQDRKESDHRHHGEETEEKIHHLIEAAENLERAGFGDEANRFREKAEQMEAEFRRNHRGGAHPEIKEIYRKLEHLHEMVGKLRKENAELREKVEALSNKTR